MSVRDCVKIEGWSALRWHTLVFTSNVTAAMIDYRRPPYVNQFVFEHGIENSNHDSYDDLLIVVIDIVQALEGWPCLPTTRKFVVL